MVIGSGLLAVLPERLGIAGYIGPIVFLTSGYSLFQAANNTAVMANATKARRGVVAGVLSLSRNLGLVTGASFMGAVFALASGTAKVASAHPDAIARGMRVTLAVAAALVSIAIALTVRRQVNRLALAILILSTVAASPARGQAQRGSERRSATELGRGRLSRPSST